MNRRLAVPFAVKGLVCKDHEITSRTRRLSCEEDSADIHMLRRLIENSKRIDCLLQDLEDDPEVVDSPEVSSELDYINASIQLGLLEITGELEETPYSDELFEEAVA